MVMGVAPFDTLEVARRLRTEAALSGEQADGLARVLADALGNTVASKLDLLELEQRLTIKVGATMAGSIAAVAALVRLI